ncbi:MAG: ABC transporter permease subunit [Treponema sp.]|nr:ABC transporter permease subunit [Treponema sp.]
MIKFKNPKTLYSKRMFRQIIRHWEYYLMLLPVLAYFAIFCYQPMYGVQIAFRDFRASRGIIGSPFVGLKHFIRFFESFYFSRLIINTVSISVLTILVSFPAPILLALMMNELRSNKFKRIIQTFTYAPHFISTVVLVGMLQIFLSKSYGSINGLIKLIGLEPVDFMASAPWFRPVYVLSGVWQSAGWGSIIYMASLTSIDPQLIEAARMDGAGRLRVIWHINIPGILPTVIILLILNVGSIMSIGFEKAFLMQNDRNIAASEIISTYVYKQGLLNAQFSFAAAVGLFNSVINLILLFTVNTVVKHISPDHSLF